jgi:hypothetical protein
MVGSQLRVRDVGFSDRGFGIRDFRIKRLWDTIHRVQVIGQKDFALRVWELVTGPTIGSTVRSCVLIEPRPKKKCPDRFVWASSHKGLFKIWGRFLFFRSASRLVFLALRPF